MNKLLFELDIKRAEQARAVALAALQDEFSAKAEKLNNAFDKDIDGMKQAQKVAPAVKRTWDIPSVDSFINEVW